MAFLTSDLNITQSSLTAIETNTQIELRLAVVHQVDLTTVNSASLPKSGSVFVFWLRVGVPLISNIIGAEIFKRALTYPAKLIAKNAGKNGSVVVEKVLSSSDFSYGYNAAKDCYEDLMSSGILDPSKVVRCCLQHATSVAKTFLTSDVVVIDLMESASASMRKRMPTTSPLPAMSNLQTPATQGRRKSAKKNCRV